MKSNGDILFGEINTQSSRNILDLCDIKYEAKESFSSFYFKFRAQLSRYLLKCGDRVGIMQIAQDEIFTPTFEEVIILWCLEKVNPELPRRIREELGSTVKQGISLKNIEHDIFRLATIISIEDLSASFEAPIEKSTSDEKEKTSVCDIGIQTDTPDPETATEKVPQKGNLTVRIKPEHKLYYNYKNETYEEPDYIGDKTSDIKLEEEDLAPVVEQALVQALEELPQQQDDQDQDFSSGEEGSEWSGEGDQEQDYSEEEGDEETNIKEEEDYYEEKVHQSISRICKICEAEFNDFQELKLHHIENHIEDVGLLKEYECDKCGETFDDEKDIKDHTKTMHSVSSLCRLCGVWFQNVKDLNAHKLKAHKKSKRIGRSVKFVCNRNGCREMFDTFEERAEHRLQCKHKPKNRGSDPCPECGKMIHKSSLKRHIQTHYKVKVRKCKLCSNSNETFKTQKELEKHKRIVHRKSKGPQMCPECGKMVHKSSMKRHRLIHLTDLKCPLCSKRYLEQKDLDNHLKFHETNPDVKTKNRNIQCEVCKRSFFDIEEFGSHVCKHFSCDECMMKFIFERNLKIHKRTHLGESVFSCELCESLFISRKALRLHKRSSHDPEQRKHKCDECGKCFLNKSQLDRHIGSHSTERPFKCDRCEKAFKQKSALDAHMLIHTGDRPYPCVDCPMRFRSLSEMKRHRETNKCKGSKLEQDFPKSEI